MATHSSVLAWRIPGTGEPGGLPSMGSHRARHDWSDLAVAVADDFLELSLFQWYNRCWQFDLWFLCVFKSNLNICKFTVCILLKPGLEDFKHYFASVWDECNCVVVWAFFGIAFIWDWSENWPSLVLSLGLEWKLTFSSPVATAEFSKFADILSTALSQHHLSGFEIAQLEFHHLH